MNSSEPKQTQFFAIVKDSLRAPVAPHLHIVRVNLVRYFVKKTPVRPTKRGFMTKVKEIETRWAVVVPVAHLPQPETAQVKSRDFEIPCNLLFENKVLAYEKMFALWQVFLDEKKVAVDENIKILRKELDDSRASRRRQRQEYLRLLRKLRLGEVVSKVGSGIDVQSIKVPLAKKQKGVIRRKHRKFINT